ncbi:MAG: antitoxin [Clostridiales bacterium]|nr:antitoxin [Candidatus Crickella equi]
MAFSIRLNDEEKALAYSYAEMHSISVGEAFKSALFEKIEDEYDIAVANEAMKEYIDSGYQSRPISELKKELGL